ncbi:MAG: 30S ribosomal protein S17 [Bradymonadales bacterium]|nr:MAG: 30S ribosomal protein S17 [Bradymonadales bacterium]
MNQRAETETKRRKLIVGRVVSNKMDKTIVVQAARLTKHPVYGKYYKKFKKYKAHDETNQCGVGDQVELIESAPISKEKAYRLKRVIEKAAVAEVEAAV